jgi:hypothetical protein
VHSTKGLLDGDWRSHTLKPFHVRCEMH